MTPLDGMNDVGNNMDLLEYTYDETCKNRLTQADDNISTLESSRPGTLSPDRVSYPLFFNGQINQTSGLFENPGNNIPNTNPILFENDIFAGKKNYELTNHLGNVQATVSDRLLFVEDG